MVKSKRLLIALILLVALTLPRFLFISIKEYEAEYFSDDRMPDSITDMPNWVAIKVLVCDKCVSDLTEAHKRREPAEGMSKRLFYDAVYHDVDRRCPVHPEVTLNRFSDFDWSNTGESAKEGKYAVPDNLISLYPSKLKDVKDENQIRMFPFFICRECQKILSEKVAIKLTESPKSDETKAFLEKIANLESLEEIPEKSAYLITEIRDYYCLDHPGTRIELTPRIPVSPVVKLTLPEDTKYISRVYRNKSTGQEVNLSIVTAGKDRRSIHRPERCLQMQGFFLKDRRKITIKMPDSKRKNLNVIKLRMENTYIDPETKDKKVTKMIVFYWYLSVERATESNLKLMAYWAWDRLILGKNYHWSYVLLHTIAKGENPEDEEKITKGLYTFMQEFFPKVER